MDGCRPKFYATESPARSAAQQQMERATSWMSYMARQKGAMQSPQSAAERWKAGVSGVSLSSVPRTCGGVDLASLGGLQLRMRYRRSWFPRRRRAAYQACLTMIRFREAALGLA